MINRQAQYLAEAVVHSLILYLTLTTVLHVVTRRCTHFTCDWSSARSTSTNHLRGVSVSSTNQSSAWCVGLVNQPTNQQRGGSIKSVDEILSMDDYYILCKVQSNNCFNSDK